METARLLGSDHWRPVVALAESALAGGRPDLSADVFEAADQPGRHRDHLRTKCLQLLGETLSGGTDSRLRAKTDHVGRGRHQKKDCWSSR